MLRLTVTLIAVTLTGLPVVPAICLSWCGEHKTTIEYCHDEAVGNGSPTVTTARADCNAPVTDNPFIREDPRPAPHTVQDLPAVRMTVSALTPVHPFIALPGNVSHAAPPPPLVLRV